MPLPHSTSRPTRRRRWWRLAPFPLAAALTCVAGLAAVRGFAVRALHEARVRETTEVLGTLDAVAAALLTAEAAQRGYLLTEDRAHLARGERAPAMATDAIARLSRLSRGSLVEQARVARLTALVRERLHSRDEILTRAAAGDRDGAHASGRVYDVDTSVGTARASAETSSLRELMTAADRRLHEAKRARRARREALQPA